MGKRKIHPPFGSELAQHSKERSLGFELMSQAVLEKWGGGMGREKGREGERE